MMDEKERLRIIGCMMETMTTAEMDEFILDIYRESYLNPDKYYDVVFKTVVEERN